ncbi:type VI secretion system tip protein VgrG, partial [Pseudomonas sp. NPDC096917]
TAGGQHLLVSAAGIYVSSPILLGGVPVPGTAALPAITSDVAALTAAVLTPNQINSLKRNAPFCEECEQCKGGVCDI